MPDDANLIVESAGSIKKVKPAPEPTKLSDFENDLFYKKSTDCFAVEKSEFALNPTLGTYICCRSPKLSSIEGLEYIINITKLSTSENTIVSSADFPLEYDEPGVASCPFFMFANGAYIDDSGTSDLAADSVVIMLTDPSLYDDNDFTITFNISETKKIPTNYLELPIFVGESTTGKKYTDSKGNSSIAEEGAEIFNCAYNTAVGAYSHAEGDTTKALGRTSHAEGSTTNASGSSSHAEGDATTASGVCSHAEGYTSRSSGSYSHAEGEVTKAIGRGSHSEGCNTKAEGKYSHAEGHFPSSIGIGSHAEGYGIDAYGDYSHVEGENSEANGRSSHAEGYYTKASSEYQHVQGKFNVEDTDNKYAHIVGNGEPNDMSNAHTLDWDGNAWFAGTVEGTKLILKSTTSGSTKRFQITVDDSGTLTATEIT